MNAHGIGKIIREEVELLTEHLDFNIIGEKLCIFGERDGADPAEVDLGELLAEAREYIHDPEQAERLIAVLRQAAETIERHREEMERKR